ncbi:MAG: glutathione S-transferase [Candidimonas sp.]
MNGMPAFPVLYSFRRCPYAMRARLALAAGDSRCELREVVLRDKPQAMLAVSPKATVPVLVLADGTVIDQSLDIMLWALRRHDPWSWMQPESGDLAQMLAMIRECDASFKRCLDRYKYPDRYDLASGIPYREQARPWLHELDCRLRTDAYLFGRRAALADMAVLPFVRQFAHVDKAWFDGQDWPGLSRWLTAWMRSELFERIMQKYPAWKSGDQPRYFPVESEDGSADTEPAA